MNRLIYILIAVLMLIPITISASIKSDIENGLSIEQAIRENVDRGASVVDSTRQAMRAAPKRKKSVLAAALQIAPSEAPALVELAIANGVPAGVATLLGLRVAEDQAEEILRVGIAADETKAVEIVKSAMRSGVNPAIVVPFVNEFVIEKMDSIPETFVNVPPGRAPTADEILTALAKDEGVVENVAPILVLPPVNGGSDRLASPN